jgi:hypothetical protein
MVPLRNHSGQDRAEKRETSMSAHTDWEITMNAAIQTDSLFK